MKPSFPSERIVESNWKVDGIKKEVPTYLVKPLDESICKKAVIYVHGLNGNGCMVKYFNYSMFDNIYLFGYDQRAQGNNLNKPSRFYKQYIFDLDKVITAFKQKFPHVEEIYLIGESWGSTICFLYEKHFSNKIDGVIGWNMPYDIIDLCPTKGWTKFKSSMKVILTFLTSINTYDESPFAEALTNNKILIRLVKTIKNNKVSNKVILACWRSMKKPWKVLKNPPIKSKYIQSMEDAMLSKKRLLIIKNFPCTEIFEKGYHILTFDDNVSDKLFSSIKSIVL